jgi:hypothetical protein
MSGVPAPGAGLTGARTGIVPDLFNMRLNQIDAVQQRGVDRMDGFPREISEVVQEAQPVTFLSHFTVATAFAGSVEISVAWTIFGIDVFQYK